MSALGLSGFAALESVIEQNESRRSEGAINSINWKNNEDKLIRFVSDDVRTVKMHSYTLCRDGKHRSFICPNQAEDGSHDRSGPCLICKYYTRKSKSGDQIPAYPSDRSLALVALREVKTSKVDGKVVSSIVDQVHDSPREIKVGDKTETVESLPIVGIINHGMRFWGSIISVFSRYGTVMDRDFSITRRGESTETTYGVASLDKSDSPDLDTQEKVTERYAKALLSHPSLDDYINRLSSLDYQRAFALVPEHEQINNSGDKNTEPESEPEGTSGEEEEGFDSLAAKLKALSG